MKRIFSGWWPLAAAIVVLLIAFALGGKGYPVEGAGMCVLAFALTALSGWAEGAKIEKERECDGSR